TLRFLGPPEIEGSVTLLNARPDLASRIKAVIFMDMVGGTPDTKVVFHMTRGPRSLPSFIHDIAWSFAAWLNQETYEYASRGVAAYPMVESAGGREPLRAESSPYDMGSDPDVYQDSSFGIPTIYMNDWPDRFIHTNLDVAGNVDPTKLGRAALIGAATGYFLASLSAADVPSVDRAVALGTAVRTALALQRGAGVELARSTGARDEAAILASLDRFLGKSGEPPRASALHVRSGSAADWVFRRLPQPKG